MAFNSGQYYKATTSTLSRAGNAISTQAGSTVRSVGQTPSYLVSTVAQDVKNLPKMPIVNQATLGDVANAVKAPVKGGLSGTVEALVGTDLKQAFSPAGVQAFGTYIGQGIRTLGQQITQTIIDCINDKLLSLTRKNPLLDLLANYEFYRSQLLGNIHRTLSDKINKLVNELLYKKLQVQQIALLRQQILNAVRTICPEANQTAVRNYWKTPSSINTAAEKSSSKLTTQMESSLTGAGKPSSKNFKDLV